MRRLIVPAVSTAVMLVVLIGLGFWQLQRMAWKHAILVAIADAETRPAVPLTNTPAPFTKIRVTGRFRDDLASLYGAEGRQTRDGPVMGAQLLVPLERDGEPTLLVIRGWVPPPTTQHAKLPADGQTSVEAFVRPGELAGMFAARDDVAGRRFYTLDPAAIGAALGLARVAPLVLVAIGPTPPETFPDPAHTLPRPSDNHLTYAIIWFALAVALAVIFTLHTRKALRP